MILENKKVAIIGAGPVGLTLAILLQRQHVDITVYERDKNPQARIWGGTLDLHEGSGQQAINKAGLLERYFANAIPMGRTIADTQANVLFTVEPHYDSPEINRNDLRKMLLESLSAGSVTWDSKFEALEKLSGKWFLRFENKPDAVADIVIGANGGMSKVRKYVTDTVVEDTGTFIIQGEVAQPEIQASEFYQLCNNNIFMAAGEGITFVANPRNNGALSYGVSFKKPAAWSRETALNFQDNESVSTFLSGMFTNWDERFRKLFRSTAFYVGLPARKLPLTKPWKIERPIPATLIGDAAHLMPPFAGQGVNTGLMDALVLSDNLLDGNFDTIAAAIADYEQRMFVYAAKAQTETSRNERAMHDPTFSFQNRFGN